MEFLAKEVRTVSPKIDVIRFTSIAGYSVQHPSKMWRKKTCGGDSGE